MTHFRLTVGAMLLSMAAGADAAPRQGEPVQPRQTSLKLSTLVPESSTAALMLIGLGVTIVTRRNRRSVRSVPA